LQDFERLKQKAGFPRDHWSASVRIERYTVESIPRCRIAAGRINSP